MEDGHVDKIERFLSGEMEGSERKDFERQLEEDEELQSEVSAYIMATEVVEQDVRNHLKEQMTQWETPEIKKRSSPRTITIILLLLVAIAVASMIWVCPSQQKENWEQFAVVNLEGIERSDNEQESIRRLNQYYLSGNYEQAEQMIKNMEPELRNSGEVEFVDALLAYREGNFSVAAESFALLKENENVNFIVQDQSEYFYLLTIIRMNACEQDCREELEDMAEDENHLRKNEAGQLIEYMGYR